MFAKEFIKAVNLYPQDAVFVCLFGGEKRTEKRLTKSKYSKSYLNRNGCRITLEIAVF